MSEQTIEATGADVEAAIAAGLARLQVDRDAVEIEVLDHGKRGVLGLGARDARVRLTLKPQAMEPEEEEEPPAAEVEQAEVEVAEEEQEQPPEQPQQPPAPAPAPAEEEAEVARGVLLELLSLLGLSEARVKVTLPEPGANQKESPLMLEISGPGADELIGRRGDTLAALQHITRLIVGREVDGWVHLVVDADGFKARRAQSLRKMALRLAEQAVRTGRTVVMEPMPPNERRVIHVTLRDNPDVTTESIGEGEHRKVTIIPR